MRAVFNQQPSGGNGQSSSGAPGIPPSIPSSNTPYTGNTFTGSTFLGNTFGAPRPANG